jgi:hypothetical protein
LGREVEHPASERAGARAGIEHSPRCGDEPREDVEDGRRVRRPMAIERSDLAIREDAPELYRVYATALLITSAGSRR